MREAAQWIIHVGEHGTNVGIHTNGLAEDLLILYLLDSIVLSSTFESQYESWFFFVL